MADFFEIKNKIFGEHDRSILQNEEILADVNMYMTNRWGSMIDPHAAVILNHTNNFYWKNLDKEVQLKMIMEFTSKKFYIKYIKKSKEEKDKDEQSLEHFAQTYEISKRELRMYANEFNIELPKLK